MSTIREGLVVRNLDGTAKTDKQAVWALARLCRLAGLPEHQQHTLHTFGTHAALFGVNPWQLQTWLGQKRIDETMLYVQVAEAHARVWARRGARGGAWRNRSGQTDRRHARRAGGRELE